MSTQVTITRSVTSILRDLKTVTHASITASPQGPIELLGFLNLAEDTLINLTEDPSPEPDESSVTLVVPFDPYSLRA